jgi:SAM-dependent methyltransferase
VDFYGNLAGYYDEVFPLNEKTLEFVRSFITRENSHILDIGCATGQLALRLAAPESPPSPLESGSIGSITAIEPDENMVAVVNRRIAEGKPGYPLKVLQGGMSDLAHLFPGKRFDLILCLGNTLVHLPSLEQIQDFLRSVFYHLAPSGVFIFQVVNYTRILDQDIRELPLIDKPRVSFSRKYTYDAAGHTVRFLTRLTAKDGSGVLENETPLYPLQLREAEPVIAETGFRVAARWGSFNRDAWESGSPALVMVLRKP